jgi:hypothetical protein
VELTQGERTNILRQLDFGSVDSESETDLDRRFVRTSDFDDFVSPNIWLALGAKGTGKSALFELFTKYEDVARSLAGGALEDSWITAGTGFSDLSEVGTGDLHELSKQKDYDHDALWRLYIAIRAGLALSKKAKSSNIPRGPLSELLVAVGQRKDLRIGPLLKSLWQMAIGSPPSEVTVSSNGISVTLKGGTRSLDVVTLLQDIQSALEAEGKDLWILFDKVDEIYPSDRAERTRALNGLMTACMSIRRTFPRIKPKVLLRTDLWRHLDFTNKSHLADKQIELSWNGDQLLSLLLKRAAVWELIADTVPRLLEVGGVEDLTRDEREDALHAILPVSAYPGQNEARIAVWIETRVTDAQQTVLPREAILLCTLSRKIQIDSGGAQSRDSLISRETIREAFTKLSTIRCDSYLAEFPELREHFGRFRGQTSFSFSRAELLSIMIDLEPNGDKLLTEMYEIGIIAPMRGDILTAEAYEIPRLYRVGLGLVVRGRP